MFAQRGVVYVVDIRPAFGGTQGEVIATLDNHADDHVSDKQSHQPGDDQLTKTWQDNSCWVDKTRTYLVRTFIEQRAQTTS